MLDLSFDKLSVLKSELRQYHILCTLQTILRTKSIPYLSKKFVLLSKISVRDTRHGSSFLSIPIYRNSFSNKSSILSVCQLMCSLVISYLLMLGSTGGG